MELKEKVDKAQQTSDKAEGALGQVMKELKNEFDCHSIDEAVKKRKHLKKQTDKSKEAFDDGLEKFNEDWSEELEEE